MAAPTAEQIQLIRDYEPALFFVGRPGEAGAERFFPSDAKRYLEHCALYRARAPFATRADWSAPVVETGKLGAIEGEAEVFIGQQSASGVPEFLATPPDQECFLQASDWTSTDARTDLDRLAARYTGEPPLNESRFWYHGEFFEAARLRRLFGNLVDPGGNPIDFNQLFVPRPNGPPVITDPALICYYLFYPGHEESLSGCIDPDTGQLYEKARDFFSFAGEWSCIAILLDRPNPTAAYAPKWVGLSNRNVDVIQVGGRETRVSMRLLPWSAMQTFEGNHSQFAVGRGSHALYLPGETPPPLISNDPAAAFCGSATSLVEPDIPSNLGTAVPETAGIVLAKLVAGAAAGSVFGPLGGIAGAVAGAVWGIAESPTLHPGYLSIDPIISVSPTVDTIAVGGLVVHPVGKRPPEVDASRAIEWKNVDNFTIGDRQYPWVVDRETQVLWGADPDGLGYTGRWGPRVVQDAQARRAGMKFPKFWQVFFDALVRNDPPSRTIVLTRDAGTRWTVPPDWNNSDNSIECIGGGGAGGGANGFDSGGSGGGGAYTKILRLALTPGADIPFQVGAGGAATPAPGVTGNGGDTFFNGATLAVAAVGAPGGAGASGANGGAGGGVAAAVGGTKFAGGAGAQGGGGLYAGAGGGGAAGPLGGGGSGATATRDAVGGGGGGGNGGGSPGATGTAGDAGNNGGNTSGGTGGGAGGAAGAVGGAGVAGGGGGGGGGLQAGGVSGAGGAGGGGTEFDASHGSGGGGGGGAGGSGGLTGSAGGSGGTGAAGGLYGGGGGGGGGYFRDGAAGQGGKGADGIIVIRYTP